MECQAPDVAQFAWFNQLIDCGNKATTKRIGLDVCDKHAQVIDNDPNTHDIVKKYAS